MTGEDVRAVREDLGLSQAAFGRRLGAKQNTVSGWESSGLSDPILVHILRCEECRAHFLGTGRDPALAPSGGEGRSS